MAEGEATFRFVRMAPRKIRVVLNLVRGRSVDRAFTILKFTKRRAVEVVEKVLKSAIDNAVKDQKLKRESLYVTVCAVDVGPTMKRYQPRAFGRAAMKRKRFSHVHLMVAEK